MRQPEDNAARQRKLGVVLGYVNTAAQTIISFIYTPLLLGGLGQAEYGLYQIIGSLSAYINIFESMLTASALRFYCQAKSTHDEGEMESVLAVARLLYGGFSCLVIVFAILFGCFFREAYSKSLSIAEIHEGLAMLAIVSLNIVINMMFYTYSVVIQGNERFVFAKLVELFGLIMQPVAVIALISGWPQAIAISVVQLVVSLISCLVKRFYAVGQLKCKIRLHSTGWKLMREMLGFSLTMFVSMVADIVFAKTGQLLIGLFMNSASVAVYSVGYQIYQAYATLGRMVSSVFVPHVTDISKESDSIIQLSRLWKRTGRISAFIVSAIIIVFALYGSEFLSLWVGKGYQEAFLIAITMMIAFVPEIVQALALTILQVMNTYKIRSLVYVLTAIGNIALSVPLIKVFGAFGSAIASLIVLLLGSGLIMNCYYKVIGLDVLGFWKEIAASQKAIPIIIAIGIAVRQISLQSEIASFLFHCGVMTVAIIAFSYLISMNKSEKQLISGLVHHFF